MDWAVVDIIEGKRLKRLDRVIRIDLRRKSKTSEAVGGQGSLHTAMEWVPPNERKREAMTASRGRRISMKPPEYGRESE